MNAGLGGGPNRLGKTTLDGPEDEARARRVNMPVADLDLTVHEEPLRRDEVQVVLLHALSRRRAIAARRLSPPWCRCPGS